MTDEKLEEIRRIHERRQTTTDDYRRTWDTDYLMLVIPGLLAEVERLRADLATLANASARDMTVMLHANVDLQAKDTRIAALEAEKRRVEELAVRNDVRCATAERENAALREIAQAVATEDILCYEGDAGDEVRCPFCTGEEDYKLPKRADRPAYHEFRHEPDCPVTQARALLAGEHQEG